MFSAAAFLVLIGNVSAFGLANFTQSNPASQNFDHCVASPLGALFSDWKNNSAIFTPADGRGMLIRATDICGSTPDTAFALNFTEPPAVNLSVSSAAASEATPGVTVTVTATAAGAVTGEQTVTLASSGTATFGADYSLSGTTVIIPDGQTSGSATFTVIDDAIDETDEDAAFTITGVSSGLTIGANASRTITIFDNDTAGAAITPTTVNVAEGGATATYRIALTSQPTANVTITITPDGQVTVSAATLTFTSANWNTPQSVTVTAVDDSISEGNHTGTITQSAASGDPNYDGKLLAPVTANIADNETFLGNYANTTIAQSGNTAVAPSFAPGNATGLNVSTTPNFRGKLEVSPATGVVRVTNAYPAGTYPVTVKATGASGTITKTFTLSVTTPAGCGANLPASFAAPVNYSASDAPNSIRIGDVNGDGRQDLVTVSGNVRQMSVFIRNTANTGFDARVNYTTDSFSGGVEIGDLNADGKQDIVTANYNQTVSVFLRNAANTGFNAKIDYPIGSSPNSVVIGDFNGDGRQDLATNTSGSSLVTVLLRNAANNGFEAKVDYPVGSSPMSIKAADFNGDGKLDLATANNAGSTISVLLRNAAGTGFDSSVDYPTGLYPTGLATGDLNGDGKEDLAVTNFGGSTVSVFLRNAANTGFDAKIDYAVAGSPRQIEAGDFNRDGKQDLAVGSGGSPTNNFSTIATLFRNADNSGFERTDYPNSNDPLSIAVGDLNNDGRQDLATGNNIGGTVSVITGACAAQISLSVSSNTASEAAAGTPVIVTATASQPVVGNQTVTLALSDTAVINSDYTLSSTTITIPDGQTSGSVTFSVIDDAVFEETEYAQLTTSGVSSGLTAAFPNNQKITISDNDVPPQLSVNDVSKTEGNSGITAFTFTVTKTGASGSYASFNFQTINGTATVADNDYALVNNQFSLAPNETTKQITVQVKGDTKIEPDETFSVYLTRPLNATIDRFQGTGTIVNDDYEPSSFQFSAANYTVNESRPRATVTVTRTSANGNNNPASVNYAASSGTAILNTDFSPASGTLNFAAGEAAKTFNVNIINDTAAEPDETVILILSNPTNSATLGTPNPATLKIVDNDAPPTSTTVVVKTTSADGFDAYGENTGSGEFVAGPGSAAPPLGSGSYQMSTGAGDGAGLGGRQYLKTDSYNGTRLDAVSQMSYRSYVVSNSGLAGSETLAPALEMMVDADGNGTRDTTLTFEPVYSPAQGVVQAGFWQTWDARAGNWRASDAVGSIMPDTDFTLDAFIDVFPNAAIVNWTNRADGRGLGFRAGQSAGGVWKNFVGAVDAFEVGTNNRSTVFNFEPTVTATLGGRAVNNAGVGIPKAKVTLKDAQNNTRTVTTSRTGYFILNDVQVGETYILSISIRGYQFIEPTRVITVSGNLNNINFTAY